MRLYHFDAHDENGPLETASASLPDHDAARMQAARLAVALAGRPETLERGEGTIIVEAYTEGEGVVLTVRLILGVEMTRTA